MIRNAKVALLATLTTVVILVVIFVGRDLYLRSPRIIECGDGQRRIMDVRDFLTQYSGYSVQFEASVSDKGKFSSKLDPVLLHELSETLQQANEFRKSLVVGFNSCAITKEQYVHYVTRFAAMDNLSRQIDQVAGRPNLGETDRSALRDLVTQYIQLSRQLTTS